MAMQILAEIITIGDEILFGQITDTNSQWMSAELDKAGIRVVRKSSVGDQREAIIDAIAAAEAVADVVLITGGLGPTKDDITKHTLCEYFGGKLIFNQEVLDNLKLLFSARGRKVTPTNEQQAYVPDCCQVVPNPVGTAPGMWFSRSGKVFVSMPGVPYEMKKMMSEQVIPRLQAQFKTPHIIHRMIKTINVPESTLSDLIEPWELALPPHIKLAYLPRMGQVRLRLTGTGTQREILNREIDEQIASVMPIISKYVYGMDDDEIEGVVGLLLTKHGLSVATAESCTGGFVAHQLTQVPGSSRYFYGSVVAYSNDVKMKLLGVQESTLARYGAVSEQVACEMAEGARKQLGTSIGISTTGVAGPDGGSPEKPVGTVWIAYSDEKQTLARKLSLTKERTLNIQLTCNALLNWLRHQVSEVYEEHAP
jgi:nicotinamide-nucleotide amidase